MSKETTPITEMGALLDALYRDDGFRKSYAMVEYYPPDKCQVIQYFDSGAGSSSALSETYTNLDIALFEEAKRLGYIIGFLKPGYVSKNEFKLTDNIQTAEETYEIMKAWRIEEHARLRKLYLFAAVPEQHRGFCFEKTMDQTDESLLSRELQLSLARIWAARNKHIEKLGLSDELLTVTLPMDRATVIQWLGTDEGVAFLMEAFCAVGWEIKKPPTSH